MPPTSHARCGKCASCAKLERARRSVLAACNPPHSHADGHTIIVWNDMLAALPCLERRSTNA